MIYVGVDCGTQSTKAVVLDTQQGRVLGEASRPHCCFFENEYGRREQRPEEWISAFYEAFSKAVDRADINPKDIRAIGISGQQHSLVALDSRGRPVHAAKLWCDTETALHNAFLIELLGGEKGCLDKLGLVLQTGYTASKLAWLRDTHPNAYKRIDSLLLPHDYLNYWLTGEKVTEAGDASGTGYFDTRTRCWQCDVFSQIAPELDPAQVLPRLIKSHEPAGKVRPQLARRLGLSSDVLVSSGGGDNMLGAIGTGNIRQGIVTLSLGTSGTVCTYSDEPVATDSSIANFCSSNDGWLPLVCTMNVTSATTRMCELFGLDLTTLAKRIGCAPIGSRGVTVLPFFNGERVPMLPEASASFLGLNSINTTQANLCRAVVEGATFGLLFGLERLGKLTTGTEQIRLIGGGANCSEWRQMVADITATQVICPILTDAAALGAAIQAAWCHQHRHGTTLEQLCNELVLLDEHSRVDPDPQSVTEYEAVYARYREALTDRHAPLI